MENFQMEGNGVGLGTLVPTVSRKVAIRREADRIQLMRYLCVSLRSEATYITCFMPTLFAHQTGRAALVATLVAALVAALVATPVLSSSTPSHLDENCVSCVRCLAS